MYSVSTVVAVVVSSSVTVAVAVEVRSVEYVT